MNVINSNQIYMQQALKKAWQYQLRTYPNPAVGCLVLYRGEIVALEAHQQAGTSHAEVLALLSAYESISGKTIDFDRFDAHRAHAFLLGLPRGFFGECTLFVTLEPCSHEGRTPSCASLLGWLKPRKVVIATLDPIKGHDGGMQYLQAEGIELEHGVCEAEALDLLEPFLIWQKRAFVLFKIAQTSNGKIGGGYLSSPASLKHVHQLRALCSTMLIGGNTVRVDRPTLDCRFTGDRAPDVVIYAHNDNFDREIPLFGVEGRDVMIGAEHIDWAKPSFVLVEGGGGMLGALRDRIDWLLQYQTPMLSTHPLGYDVLGRLSFLHVDRVGVDLRIWSRMS